MIKKMPLSSLAGIFATVLFLATPSAEAACQGFCADILLINGCQHAYTGCTITYDAQHKPLNVTCSYAAGCNGFAPESGPET
jgi:hypothetical protein